ncbi:TPA: hypothetical protein RZC51_001596 [Burkholderia cenocepacia]|nr:hypothetical protein [Burkholderia cenocepacia]
MARAIPKHNAASPAPLAWPSSRAVPMMPLAPPLRSGGARADRERAALRGFGERVDQRGEGGDIQARGKRIEALRAAAFDARQRRDRDGEFVEHLGAQRGIAFPGRAIERAQRRDDR